MANNNLKNKNKRSFFSNLFNDYIDNASYFLSKLVGFNLILIQLCYYYFFIKKN